VHCGFINRAIAQRGKADRKRFSFRVWRRASRDGTQACIAEYERTVRIKGSIGDDQLFAADDFGVDADNHSGRDAVHHVRVTAFADGGDAMVLDPDVGLCFVHAIRRACKGPWTLEVEERKNVRTHLVDPLPVDDESVGNDAVERLAVGHPGRLTHPLADRLA
jgi:hypothetical protein